MPRLPRLLLNACSAALCAVVLAGCGGSSSAGSSDGEEGGAGGSTPGSGGSSGNSAGASGSGSGQSGSGAASSGGSSSGGSSAGGTAGASGGAGGSAGTIIEGGSSAGGASGVGGTGGQLEVRCFGELPFFPEFAKDCADAGDCVLVRHTTDCCGSELFMSIRADQEPAFDQAEAICDMHYPLCGCAPQGISVEDGSLVPFGAAADVVASCDGGTCRAHYEPSSFACGPMSCVTGEVCQISTGGGTAGTSGASGGSGATAGTSGAGGGSGESATVECTGSGLPTLEQRQFPEVRQTYTGTSGTFEDHCEGDELVFYECAIGKAGEDARAMPAVVEVLEQHVAVRVDRE